MLSWRFVARARSLDRAVMTFTGSGIETSQLLTARGEEHASWKFHFIPRYGCYTPRID